MQKKYILPKYVYINKLLKYHILKYKKNALRIEEQEGSRFTRLLM